MQENPLELTEGSFAPDFAMRDKHGKKYNLSDLRGKRDVVIYFYPEDLLITRPRTKSFVKTGEFLILSLLILTMKCLKNMAFMDLRNSWDENTWVLTGPPSLLTRQAR